MEKINTKIPDYIKPRYINKLLPDMRYIFFLLLFVNVCGAQSDMKVLDNIVPNPGFEDYSSAPIGWFYRGEHFSKVMKYWSSATAASPDVFGPRVRVPEHWTDKGFGDQYPHSGESMVGFTVFGCDNGKPHCREYVQVQLLEPLVPKQNYYLEFWLVHLPRSLQTNNIGVHFSDGRINVRVDELLTFEPHFNQETIVRAENHVWTKVSGHFTASEELDYIVIGNFFPDSLTVAQEFRKDNLQFGYYYMDDVLLKKVPPILEVPLDPNDLSLLELEVGKVFQLKNIFFDTDKSELLPRSFIELNKLLHIMEDNPNMVIEVRGHTDSVGKDQYNSYLSRKRAEAVMQFLKEKGISSTRMHAIGLGSTQPIADNETDEGRQMNRRVEFLVVRK